MKLILILFTIIMSSCSTNNFHNRTVENYYQSAGIEKYFLSELPAWANYSERAACFRKSPIHLFDLEQMMKNLNYDYKMAIQFQATFTEEYNQVLTNGLKEAAIPFLELQNIFFKSTEKINGKIYVFNAPTYKRVNLVWIDSMLVNKSEEKKLRQFLTTPVFDEGVPVLVSLCMTKKEIEAQFPLTNYSIISAEMFSIFDPQGKRSPVMKFYFDEFFNSNQSLYFYSREKIQLSNEFIGKLKYFSF